MIALSLILPALVGLFGGVMCLNWLVNTASWLLQGWGMASLFFWTDSWVTELKGSSISDTFPRLFSFVIDGQLSMSDVLS